MIKWLILHEMNALTNENHLPVLNVGSVGGDAHETQFAGYESISGVKPTYVFVVDWG